MANYILLERITVGAAGASSVTFNNIPQTGYTDLKLVMSARTNSSNITDQACIQFGTSGGISTSGYSDKTLYVSGGSALSFSNSGTFTYETRINGGATTSNSFSNVESYIPNYTSSNYKSMSNDGVAENNATASGLWLGASLWSNTGAITSIKIYPDGGSFVQYCTFSLYALAAVGTTPTKAPKAIGGDIIQTDGTYWYHAFLSSGSFTPQTALSCDVLVVAGGGGGGGYYYAGGGGAGGLLAFASQSLSSGTGYTCTVGAPGAGGNGSAQTSGAQGGNSQFAALTAAVGGGYGAKFGLNGGTGGNGGGGGADPGTVAGTGGTGTQGYNGGNSQTASGHSSGGGGAGAGGAGGAATDYIGGAGGNGVNTVTNWSGGLSSALTTLGLGVSGYIAGGGGGGGYVPSSGVGGAAGSGGGGVGGGTSTTAASGIANTGSGGGGATNGTNGGNGGSGLVIVRYAY